MNSTLDLLKDAIEDDLRALKDAAEQDARDYALFAAQTLEKVGKSGATPEMVQTGANLMALRLANILRKTEKQAQASMVNGWIIAARVIYRVVGP